MAGLVLNEISGNSESIFLFTKNEGVWKVAVNSDDGPDSTVIGAHYFSVSVETKYTKEEWTQTECNRYGKVRECMLLPKLDPRTGKYAHKIESSDNMQPTFYIIGEDWTEIDRSGVFARPLPWLLDLVLAR